VLYRYDHEVDRTESNPTLAAPGVTIERRLVLALPLLFARTAITPSQESGFAGFTSACRRWPRSFSRSRLSMPTPTS
jgi:hypothetical protein